MSEEGETGERGKLEKVQFKKEKSQIRERKNRPQGLVQTLPQKAMKAHPQDTYSIILGRHCNPPESGLALTTCTFWT
jgi:hypothetical protein